MDIERLAGTKLGNYKIETLLGRGGMGVVYKARQISLDRSVALKILSPSLSSDSSFVKRFQREAQAVAQLDHPNIVQIFDTAKAKDLHFFSMQYVEGKTLDEVLKQKGRLNPDEAINIVLQAAHGIEHAHKNGIIHRDIKPSNIILDDSGSVKVMDFGLARSTEERSKLTESGTIIGTLDYMSPEQCHGEKADGRTDIYSLGVVLYETLTGRTPFEAPSEAALLNKIINEDVPDIQTYNPDVPISLSKVVLKAMAKDKEVRYSEIGELIQDLRSCADALDPAKETKPIGVDTSPASSRRRRVGMTVIAAILVCLCFGIIPFLRKPKEPATVSEGKTYSSIAVLPFADMSPDKDQEYFCDGLSEELINALTHLEDLRVIARTSAFYFKDQNIDIREIGKTLDVETILEGSVRKSGNKLRITAQLVDVVNNTHLWSERYEREMRDVFAIQDEITLAIVERLKPRLLGKEKARIAKRQSTELEAYNLYLKGRHFWHRRDIAKSIDYFEQAIEKAPNYAPAYAGLADALSDLPWSGRIRSHDVFPKAKEAALKALELDETLAEAHTSFASVISQYEYDWSGAEKEIKRAIELNPGNAHAHAWYGGNYMWNGRFDEAIREISSALELDPLSPHWNISAVSVFAHAGKLEEAEEALRRGMELYSDLPGAHGFLAMAYVRENRYDEAIREFEKERMIRGTPHIVLEAAIGSTYALMGQPDKARKVLNGLLEQSKSGYISPSWVGRLYLTLGEHDLGFEWLERAYEERDIFLLYLGIEPGFEIMGLDSDPRYISLLERMNLESSKRTKKENWKLEEKTYSSIAVLPFVDMSQKKDQEYFCDGMSETLINELTQIEDLRVIARTSTFSFKGQNIDVREIGKKLGVGAILEGSIQRAGNKLRITAQLVDTEAGHHLWSEKYDREMKDIFALQDEISQSIVDNLMPELVGSERTKIRAAQKIDPEAYDLYLMGLHFRNKVTEEGTKKAFHYFEQAIEKDSRCAEAYAELAGAYVDLGFWNIQSPKEVFPKAKEAALKALEIDDTLADAHAAMGYVKAHYEWDWDGAEKECRRAIELNPGLADGHHTYGMVLAYLTRFDEAIREMKLGVELDPRSSLRRLGLGWAYNYARRYDEAMEEYQKILQLDPSFIYVYLHIGGVYIHQSRFEDALKEFKKYEALSEGLNTEAKYLIACAYALMDNRKEAHAILNDLLEQSKHMYIPPSAVGRIYFCLGNNDKGFEWLEKAYEQNDYWVPFLKMEPAVDILNLRADPRYHEMLRKVGLDK